MLRHVINNIYFYISDKCSVVSRVSFKDESVLTDYGAPQYLTVNYTVTSDNQNPGMFI